MKENDGKAARRKLTNRLLKIIGFFFVLIIIFSFLGLGGKRKRNLREPRMSRFGEKVGKFRDAMRERATDKVRDAVREKAADFRLGMRQQFSEKDEGKILERVLSGHLHLVELETVEEELLSAPPNSYAGVYGKFCRIDWSLHKKDPSSGEHYTKITLMYLGVVWFPWNVSLNCVFFCFTCPVPMFRDLVQNSKDCDGKQWKFNLHKIAQLARERDAMNDNIVHPLNLTAVVFHESRCGSTLAANTLAAMDPPKHRVYSESQPGATAIKSVCGEEFTRCTQEQASIILRDTMYIMSRSDDPIEEKVFFKFQSITTKALKTFQLAYPDVPWMFIYRDPVQVMMSHIKDDETLHRANCARSRRNPPRDVQAIARRHGYSDARALEPVQYCAAHLAAITEAAVKALNDKAIPVDYQTMPEVIWENVLPKILGRTLTPTEIRNMDEISHQYSKGRGKRHKEFEGDSQQKEKAASDAVRSAAVEFLQESFDNLKDFQPKLLS